MMFRKLMTVAALATVTTTVANAQAPAAKPFSFGVFAGAAVPTGDFGKGVKTGWTAGGNVGFNVASLPVGFRVDAAYSAYTGKGTPSVDVNTYNLTGNVVYDIPLQGAVRPYLIGGIGYYNQKIKGTDAEGAFGFNAGAGVTIPLSGFNTFVEARFNQASKNGAKMQFIPLVFGIRF